MKRNAGLGRLLKSWAGALTAPAPDPRQGFAQARHRQRDLLAEVRQALADVRAAAGRLQARVEEMEVLMARLEEQASSQLLAGRDDLARAVLARRVEGLRRLRALRGEVCAMENEEQRLVVVEQRLATEIEAFQARQEVIAAQYTAAEAQVRISEALTGVSQELSDLGLALELARESTGRMQARAAAIDELTADGVLEGAAGARAADDQAAVEAEIVRLRRRLSRIREGA